MKIQLAAEVNNIIQVENKVYASLKNGQIAIFLRSEKGNWLTGEPNIVETGAESISFMLYVAEKLWCGSHNEIKVLNPTSMNFTLEVRIVFLFFLCCVPVFFCDRRHSKSMRYAQFIVWSLLVWASGSLYCILLSFDSIMQPITHICARLTSPTQ